MAKMVDNKRLRATTLSISNSLFKCSYIYMENETEANLKCMATNFADALNFGIPCNDAVVWLTSLSVSKCVRYTRTTNTTCVVNLGT